MIRRKGRKHGTSLGPPTDVPKKAGSVNIEAIGRRASVVAYVFMLAAIGSIFALSWEGLTHFGEEVLGLRGWMVHIVPGSLDGAVIMFGCMAIVSMIAGENATSLRFLVQICAIGSAVFNGYQGWISADTEDRYFAGSYYACLSLLVALISHWFFRRIKRAARIEEGTLSVETVHFSVTEWTKFPVRRWKARTLALEYGITDPRLAITLEASVNQRIDARVMRALEAYRNDETTPVYEFFPPEPRPERNRKRGTSRRNAPELPRMERAEHPAISDAPERESEAAGIPEQTTGTVPELAGTTEPRRELTTGDGGTPEHGHAHGQGDDRTGRTPDRSAPESPESAGQSGIDTSARLCVGAEGECGCDHRNALERFRTHAEAVDYGRNVAGIHSGSDLTKWLRNHGRKVGQSTVYDALKASTGTAGVVPFRRVQ